jgi:hypothetical protein
MHDSASSPLAGEPTGKAVPVDSTSLALRLHGAQIQMSANYSALLKSMIFPHPIDGFDRKSLAQFRRLLDDPQALTILALIWQASDSVSQYALAAAGLCQTKTSEHLTSHGLAVKIAGAPEHLAKINSRIRNIGIAASAYGLIERNGVNKTRVDLRGTALLHDFMVALSHLNIPAMLGLVPLLMHQMPPVGPTVGLMP